MRNDPVWAKARALPRSKKQERAQAFSALRKKYHFSEYELHEYAKLARVSWIANLSSRQSGLCWQSETGAFPQQGAWH
jgi:hypothetical protein